MGHDPGTWKVPGGGPQIMNWWVFVLGRMSLKLLRDGGVWGAPQKRWTRGNHGNLGKMWDCMFWGRFGGNGCGGRMLTCQIEEFWSSVQFEIWFHQREIPLLCSIPEGNNEIIYFLSFSKFSKLLSFSIDAVLSVKFCILVNFGGQVPCVRH